MSDAALAQKVQAALRVLNPERRDIERASAYTKELAAPRAMPRQMPKESK
jgi:hypothetical protein